MPFLLPNQQRQSTEGSKPTNNNADNVRRKQKAHCLNGHFLGWGPVSINNQTPE